MKQSRRQADAAMATFVVAFGALVVSMVGSFFVYRAYEATRDQVGEARRQTELAKRQVVAAERNLPRALLYVGFPRPTSTELDTVKHANGRRGFRVAVPIRLTNYGQLPATIMQVHARMYVAGSDGPSAASPLVVGGFPGRGFGASASSPSAWDLYAGQVITVSGNLDLDPVFAFDDQPVLRTRPDHLERWLYVFVSFEDPSGGHRETSLLGTLGDAAVSHTDDKRYNYQR